jgi:uncharacterized protein
MAVRRDATLNLAALLRNAPGSDDTIEDADELYPTEEMLERDGLRLEGPLHWSLQITNTGGDDDFIVEGEVSGTAVLECRRCLSDAPTEVASSFVYPMLYRPGDPAPLEMVEDDAQEELLVFTQPQVDFAEFLTQLFAIDLPLAVLCREDCRGLSVDGVNLNEHPELDTGERRPDRRSPFDALKDIDL